MPDVAQVERKGFRPMDAGVHTIRFLTDQPNGTQHFVTKPGEGRTCDLMNVCRSTDSKDERAPARYRVWLSTWCGTGLCDGHPACEACVAEARRRPDYVEKVASLDG